MIKIFDTIKIIFFLLIIQFNNNLVYSQCPTGYNSTNYGCSKVNYKTIQGVMCKPLGVLKNYVFSDQPNCPIISPTSPPIYGEIGRTTLYTIENGILEVTQCSSSFYKTIIYNFGKNCLNSSDSYIKTDNYKIEKDFLIQSCSNNITYFVPTFNISGMLSDEMSDNGYCKQFGAINGFYSPHYYADIQCPNCNNGKCINYTCTCDKAYQVEPFCRVNYCDQPINPCVGNRTCDRVNASCYCSPGFSLNDKGDCVDINECLVSSSNGAGSLNYSCPINFICNNNIGSYSCDCPFTSTDNNKTCTIPSTTTSSSSDPNLIISRNSTTLFNSTNPNSELFETLKFKSLIIIKSLNELNFQNKIIKQHNLESLLWTFENKTNDLQIETYYYNTTIKTTSISKSKNKSTEIKLLFNWYKDINSTTPTTIRFANQEIEIEPYSLKFNIEISSYSFESDLNTLQLIIQTVVIPDGGSENVCPTNSINTDNVNMDHYKIKINDRSLNCLFIKRGIVDGLVTTLSNSYSINNSTDLSIAINIPHYENLIQMDPSFSILVDHTTSTDQSECNQNEKSRKWVKITIGVVVGVVGSTVLVIVGFILYKRHQTNVKVGINKLKKLGKD
ncbi:hypothetical protein ACTA71_012295 [Dictyostelium dimigraforme]